MKAEVESRTRHAVLPDPEVLPMHRDALLVLQGATETEEMVAGQ